MKKVLFVALSLMLALTFVTSAFAWSGCNIYHVAFCPEGYMTNASSGEGSSSEANIYRNDWNMSRNPANDCTDADPQGKSVVFADTLAGTFKDRQNEDATATVKVEKLVAPSYLYCDPNLNEGDSISFEFRKGDVNGFAGIVIGDGVNAKDVNITNNGDYHFTELPAKSDAAGHYVMATGFGFTFLKDSNTKIRLFARCLDGSDLDVIYYDVDLGVDLTKAYYTYSFFYTKTATVFAFGKALANATFYGKGISAASHEEGTTGSDNPIPAGAELGTKVVATFEYGDVGAVDTKAGAYTIKGNYARTAAIKDAADNVKASTKTALISAIDGNYVDIAVSGDGTTAFLKTTVVGPNGVFETPDEAYVAPEQPENPEQPEQPEEPEEPRKTGDVSILVAIVAVAALAVVVLKKRENV